MENEKLAVCRQLKNGVFLNSKSKYMLCHVSIAMFVNNSWFLCR